MGHNDPPYSYYRVANVPDLEATAKAAHKAFAEGVAKIEEAVQLLIEYRRTAIGQVPKGHVPMHGHGGPGQHIRGLVDAAGSLIDSVREMKPKSLPRLLSELAELVSESKSEPVDSYDRHIMLDVSDLSGDPTSVSLAEFLRDNAEVPPPDEEIASLRSLAVGQSTHLGIGGGSVVVRRVR
jgi:hypothetical protein